MNSMAQQLSHTTVATQNAAVWMEGFHTPLHTRCCTRTQHSDKQLHNGLAACGTLHMQESLSKQQSNALALPHCTHSPTCHSVLCCAQEILASHAAYSHAQHLQQQTADSRVDQQAVSLYNTRRHCFSSQTGASTHLLQTPPHPSIHSRTHLCCRQ